MGMSGGSGNDHGYTTLAEINVTPLVDVMLVLLTIFMVASSVETIQVSAERERLLKEKQEEDEKASLLARLEKVKDKETDQVEQQNRERRQRILLETQEEKFKEVEEQIEDKSQNVPIELPKTNSEAVNLAEQKKIVITVTSDMKLFIGDTQVLDCLNAPGFEVIGDGTAQSVVPESTPISPEERTRRDALFKQCLILVEKKIVANEKLKADKECYLRADRRLDYGVVLALMATIRRAGITKFGLVAEELDEPPQPGPEPGAGDAAAPAGGNQ